MKKLLLLLMIVPMIGFGQEKTSAIISVDKLYIGIENPITISSPGKNNENLTVSFKDGRILCTNKSEGKYVLIPSGKYNKRVSDVSIYEGDEKLSTIEVKLFEIPRPQLSAGITLDTIDNNTVSKESLFTLDLTFGLPADWIESEDHDFLSKLLSCDVTRFTVYITDGSGHSNVKVSGSQLSHKAIKELKKCRSGTQVFITDIYIRPGRGSKMELLNDRLYFTIK